jgi:hypothetical protein
MRKIDMKQIREVLRLHLLTNLSARKIQGATSVARTTVQEYIKRYSESDSNIIIFNIRIQITKAGFYCQIQFLYYH